MMTMHKRADELSGQHMGHTVTIHRDSATITGVLSGIEHTADLVADQRLCTATPTVTAGRITYTITIGTMQLDVRADEVVTISD